jgi:osmotically-inducible protein OsmY
MTTTHAKTDHQIQTAIVKELDRSSGVDSQNIGVGVTDGAVTLSGEVASIPERDAAIEAARRIHCVLALVDDIVVRRDDLNYNDADIARAANSRLGHLAQLPGAPVKAAVHGHSVTLTGCVDWHYQREAARVAVASLVGVSEVNVEVAIRPTPSRAETKDAIHAALARGARSEAHRIDVEIIGHMATLRGQARSWEERREVENAAWSAPGITDVDNQLVLAP